MALFGDKESVTAFAEELKDILSHVPDIKFNTTSISTLGGAHRASVMGAISLDSKGDWSNGIFENSRYMKYTVGYDGSMYSLVVGHVKTQPGSIKNYEPLPKFRKTKVADVKQAAKKILDWVLQAKKVGQANEGTWGDSSKAVAEDDSITGPIGYLQTRRESADDPILSQMAGGAMNKQSAMKLMDQLGDRMAKMEERGKEGSPEYKKLEKAFKMLDKKFG